MAASTRMLLPTPMGTDGPSTDVSYNVEAISAAIEASPASVAESKPQRCGLQAWRTPPASSGLAPSFGTAVGITKKAVAAHELSGLVAASGCLWPEPPRPEPQRITVKVFSLAGSRVCELQCSLRVTAAKVKSFVARACCVPPAELRLVHAGAVLKDADTLETCSLDGEEGSEAVIIQSIRRGMSSIGRHLQMQAKSPHPDIAIDASLSGIVDSALRTEHERSERMRPQSAVELARRISDEHRAELLGWTVQAFDVMRFDSAMLHSVVLMMDRFYSKKAGPVEMGRLQEVLLAIVCTELKLAREPHSASEERERVLLHLSHHRVPMQVILRMEYEVLLTLGFEIGAPTSLTFLRELGLRASSKQAGEPAMHLALFLLELALFEPRLQYGQPHVVLAAAALSGALRSLEGLSELQEECLELRDGLLEDLASYIVEPYSDVEAEAFTCEEKLLDLWLIRAAGQGDCHWQPYYSHVEAKFAHHDLLPGAPDFSAAAATAARGRLLESHDISRPRQPCEA